MSKNPTNPAQIQHNPAQKSQKKSTKFFGQIKSQEFDTNSRNIHKNLENSNNISINLNNNLNEIDGTFYQEQKKYFNVNIVIKY